MKKEEKYQKALIWVVSFLLICTFLIPSQVVGTKHSNESIKNAAIEDWSEDIKLTNLTCVDHWVGEHAIAVDGSNIHVVYRESWGSAPFQQYEIRYIYSMNRGETWGNHVNITDNDGWSSMYPDVATYGNNVYAVWQDMRSSGWEVYFKYSNDSGQTWNNDTSLTSNDGYYSQHPSMAVNGSNIHIVWEDERSGSNYFELFYKRSIDGGVTWDDGLGNVGVDRKLTLCLPPDADCLPRIAINGDNIYLFWSKWFETGPHCFEVAYMYSWNNGKNWSTPKLISSEGYESSDARIAVTSNQLHVVWTDERDRNKEIYYRNSTDNGDSWGSETRLTNTPSDEYSPHITVNGSWVWASWWNEEDHCGYYRLSTDNGTTWEDPIQLTTQSGTPILGISDGYVHAVFTSDRTGNNEIYYKRYPKFNDPPVINDFYPLENLTITENQNVTFMVNASDPDNDTIGYQWYLNNELLIGENNPTYTFHANSTCSGTFEIKVVISDNISLPVNHSWTLIVINVGELYDNISDLQGQITQLNIIISELNDAINNLTQSLTLIWNELNQSVQNYSNLQNQTISLMDTLSVIWDLLNQSKMNETQLQGIISNLTDNLISAQSQISVLWDLWNMSKINETALQNIISELNQNLNTSNEQITILWDLLNQSKVNGTDLQNMLNQSKQNETELQNQINNLESENKKLKKELNETKKTPWVSGVETLIILIGLCVIVLISKIVKKKKDKMG